MPFKETMLNCKCEEIDTAPFRFQVITDGLENGNTLQLILRPTDPAVVIYRDYYDEHNRHTDSDRLEAYETNVFYDDENDEITLNVFNGFDVAIFNICSLLNIGRVHIDDSVPCSNRNFAPVHDRVMQIILTLEEFKKLDGFVAVFKFTKYFILFKGLLIGSNYIHEDVKDGSDVPFYTSDRLARGESIFKF